MYTRRDVLKTARPTFAGRLSHRAPFAFETGPLQPRADAMRMMNGTPAIPAYYAALAGLDINQEVGVARIRERSKALTAHLLDLT